MKVRAYNLDKFGLSKEFNVLCITGLSGSGKTTLAKQFSDLGFTVFNLDDFYGNEYYSDEEIVAYIQKIAENLRGSGHGVIVEGIQIYDRFLFKGYPLVIINEPIIECIKRKSRLKFGRINRLFFIIKHMPWYIAEYLQLKLYEKYES